MAAGTTAPTGTHSRIQAREGRAIPNLLHAELVERVVPPVLRPLARRTACERRTPSTQHVSEERAQQPLVLRVRREGKPYRARRDRFWRQADSTPERIAHTHQHMHEGISTVSERRLLEQQLTHLHAPDEIDERGAVEAVERVAVHVEIVPPRHCARRNHRAGIRTSPQVMAGQRRVSVEIDMSRR